MNITSNATPGDIYSKVSARADQIVARRLDTVSGYIDPRLATERLPYEWKFDRSAAKADGSMTLAYGARPISAREKLETMLNERGTPWIRPIAQDTKIVTSPVKGNEREVKVTEKDIDPRMTDYASALWNGVIETITRPVRAMGVMRKIFSEYADAEMAKTLENPERAETGATFISPSGFPCNFFRPEMLTYDDGFQMRVRVPNLSNGASR